MLPSWILDIMANLRVVYRIIIILFIILISIQYFYFNPLNKTSSTITSSQTTRSDNHPLASLFFFKTADSKHDFLSDKIDINNNNNKNDLITDVLSSSSSVVFRQTTNNESTASSSPKHVAKNGTVVAVAVAVASQSSNNHSNNTTTTTNSSRLLDFCPVPPPNLLGFVKVNLTTPPSLQSISRIHSDLELGGHFKPSKCRSKDKVAIIVPFRDREEHLRIFLYNIHPVLKRQLIEYNIYVIEQGGGEPFNRAMLFNVGFNEAMKRDKYDCFIFHDVDLIPENDYNLYNCPIQPRHMSVAVDKMKYQLPYKTLFGGISALRTQHFKLVNGFSNVFWGWGAEDDDMANRIAFRGLYISRPPPDIARYKMLKHKPQKLNNNRYRMLLKGKQRFNVDGLSSLNYTVEQLLLERLFTLVRVQLAKIGDG